MEKVPLLYKGFKMIDEMLVVFDGLRGGGSGNTVGSRLVKLVMG
jgi:hypothetical protein